MQIIIPEVIPLIKPRVSVKIDVLLQEVATFSYYSSYER